MCSTPYLTDILELPDNRAHQNPAVLHQKYVLERATLEALAKEFLCSRAAIRLALIKAQIPLRRRADLDYVKPGLAYGTTLVKGRRVESAAEHRVIETIKSLRRAGLSYDKIAENLTTLGIPTKARRAKWNGGCVRAILLRHDPEADRRPT